MRVNNIILVLTLLCLGLVSLAQKDAMHVYDGNNYYHSGKFPESTEQYREAIKKNPNNAKAYFNLGNSLYKNALAIRESKENFIQGNRKVTPDSLAMLVFEEAAQSFAQTANTISDKDTLHRAWHNIGNCYLQKKDYKNAAEAYKKSLKFNSKDEETRYNLAYALKHMPKDQGGGGQNQQQQQKQEDKNDKNKNAAPKNEMSKDQAEQLLKALMQDEKKLQDKRKQKQQDAGNTTKDKDW